MCADPEARTPVGARGNLYTMLSVTLDSQGIMSGHDPNKVRLSYTGSHKKMESKSTNYKFPMTDSDYE